MGAVREGLSEGIRQLRELQPRRRPFPGPILPEPDLARKPVREGRPHLLHSWLFLAFPGVKVSSKLKGDANERGTRDGYAKSQDAYLLSRNSLLNLSNNTAQSHSFSS